MEGKAQTLLQRDSGEPRGSAMDRAVAPPRAWRRLAIPVGVVILLLAVGAGVLISPRGRVYRVPLDRLTIATAQEGLFEDFIPVRATVAPYLTAYLTTDQGGTVRQVLVEDGATVKSGQALIVLSNPALQLQVAAQQLVFEQTRFQYQRDLLDIEHHISKLQGDLARDKILLDGNAIAPSTYKQEQQEYDYFTKLRAATLESRDVERNVRTTQLTGSPMQAGGPSAGDIANAGVNALTIRAPMDGQLSALEAEVGQSKAQGAVLGQVNAADRFKLTAQVDEFHVSRVAIGQEALFTVNGRDHKARIAKVYPQVVNGTFKIDLYFEAPPPSGIHVGQAIDLKVQMGGASSALMVANGPFYQDTGGNWAFVLLPDGQSAVKRPIRLGRRNPQFVEVIDGLRAGDKVIVSGYEAYQKMDQLVIERHPAAH
jgi:HlyD family secretion protein